MGAFFSVSIDMKIIFTFLNSARRDAFITLYKSFLCLGSAEKIDLEGR